MQLLALHNSCNASSSSHPRALQPHVKTTDSSFCIFLIIHSILDCTASRAAAANKQNHCSMSVLPANMVYGQTCGPGLAQTDMEACFHGPEPTS